MRQRRPYFASPVTNGPLTRTGECRRLHVQFSQQPSRPAPSTPTNYWVDVVFNPAGANTAPTAVADTANATEKGGIANGSGGSPASGNVLTNDTDPDAGDTKTVTAVRFGATNGTLGTALAGAHGSLVLNASGAFTYTVNETDAAVQALRQSTNTLTDVFSYTMRDTAGATSTTTLTVSIHGANDAPVLAVQTGSQNAIVGSAFSLALPAGTFTDVDAGDTLTYTATAADGSPASRLADLQRRDTHLQRHAGGCKCRHAQRQGFGHRSRRPRRQRDIQYRRDDNAERRADGGRRHGRCDREGRHCQRLGRLARQRQCADQRHRSRRGRHQDRHRGQASARRHGTLGTALAGAHGSLVLNASGAFTYTVNETDAAVQALRQSTNTLTDVFSYTMRDTAGATSTTTLTVSIHGANDAPVLAVQTGSQNAIVGSAFSLALPAGTFTDVDAGDTLTYTATAADGSPLPAWLAFNAATRTFSGTPAAANVGTLSVKVSATDLGGLAASETFNIAVTTAPTTVSLFSASNTPAQTNLNDGSQLEVGVKFTSSVAGQITALKFYRSASDTGSDILDLWTSTGTKLASATFTNTAASGWQTVSLATPVAIAANTTYVASYHTTGAYVATDNFFTTAVTSGALTAPSTATAGGNGVYAYGGTDTAGIFPTNTFSAANYWADVVFASSAANTSPTATNLSAAESYTEDTPLNLIDIVVSDVDSANVTATLTLSNTGRRQPDHGDLGRGDLDLQCRHRRLDRLGRDRQRQRAAGGRDVHAGGELQQQLHDRDQRQRRLAPPSPAPRRSPASRSTTRRRRPTCLRPRRYTEDTALNLTDIVVSDVDSATVTATLTLSNPAAGSLTTATSGAVTSTYNAGTGVWTASGAIADVNTLLAGVTFTPAANFNGNFTIATSVYDGVAPASPARKAMTGTAVNDAPTATNLSRPRATPKTPRSTSSTSW